MISLKLKFSNDYPKLYGQKRATLLQLLQKDRIELSNDFVEYDTVTCDGDHYPLPAGRYFVLVFLGDKLIPFTTVRRLTHEKYRYYYGNLLRLFDIEVARQRERHYE